MGYTQHWCKGTSSAVVGPPSSHGLSRFVSYQSDAKAETAPQWRTGMFALVSWGSIFFGSIPFLTSVGDREKGQAASPSTSCNSTLFHVTNIGPL